MEVEALIRDMIRQEASDLHLTADAPAFFRVDGVLRPACPEAFVTSAELAAWLGPLAGRRSERVPSLADGVDFSVVQDGRRLRGNAYRAAGQLAVALRLLPERIPTLAEIDVPTGITQLVKATQGLVLVTGRTGAGKSTTLAAFLLELAAAWKNEGKGLHCITLEDPIEFQYHLDGSLFHQRELGRDFSSFAAAIRDALREDPDVLLVSELRDQETIRAALAAAEAGTLVLATLHARTAAEAPQRLSDFFAADERPGVRAALASSLAAVIAQRLVPAAYGRHAVFEVLLRTPAVCRMIHDGEDAQLASAMQAGARQGMTTFAQEGRRLAAEGVLPQTSLAALEER